ncbi:RNA repair transcriptional activator RtcR [Prosthecobacter fluviatilis]|uniref:RNA repair transcriptional activator RtcR n=1 Tax=Prosthecobacter fluviatilis TaxID=445931 RepID=A0ABW0KSV6_9BACT
MPYSRPTIVFGFLGSNLDRASGPERWSKWRPTVAMCQQEDLLISRLELLVEPKFSELARQVKADIEKVSPDTMVVVHEFPLKDPWDFQEVYERLYDFVRGFSFDTDKADYLIHLTTGTHVAQICWFLLNEANFIPARLLQTSPSREGGRDASAAGRYEIIDLDLSKYDRLSTRFAQEQERALDFLKSGIATKSKSFNKLIGQIELVAVNSKAPILIMGPTGAGKSMLAGRIYDLRRERAGLGGRFVEVNCATLRGDQAMSALFGHRRGAFTGAQSDRPGLLKEADKGLIFLDEIGELGLDEQAMLLRALEDKTFLPLGSDKAVQSDFQLIAGTNRDLRAQVAAGKFRDDLLARINLWTFTLPSLAERREDIAANLDFELERFAKTHRRQVRMNKEARETFLKFARSPEAKWSANFRDLNAAVTRMATLAPRGRITVECVETEMARLREGWREVNANMPQTGSTVLNEEQRAAIDPFDLAQLDYVLQVCRESKTLSDAGRKLFAVSRTKRAKMNDADRLKKYLARFKLRWDDLAE